MSSYSLDCVGRNLEGSSCPGDLLGVTNNHSLRLCARNCTEYRPMSIDVTRCPKQCWLVLNVLWGGTNLPLTCNADINTNTPLQETVARPPSQSPCRRQSGGCDPPPPCERQSRGHDFPIPPMEAGVLIVRRELRREPRCSEGRAGEEPGLNPSGRTRYHETPSLANRVSGAAS